MRSYSDGRKVYYLGDTHGIGATMKRLAYEQLNNCIIIHVGDVGIGFGKNEETHLHDIDVLEDFLAEANITLICNRGNHDNPKYWKTDINNLKYLVFAKDYEVINIGGSNHLFIGGAISIDRTVRTVNIDYWLDDIFILDEDKLNKIDVNIQTVVTHTSPSFVYPIGCNVPIVNDYASYDKTLKRDLIKERSDMDKVFDIVVIKGVNEWYYGHYHPRNVEQEEFSGITFRCLPIGHIH